MECQPVDMFGWTGHVETVCLLSKLREAKHHVNVKLDMDEMDSACDYYILCGSNLLRAGGFADSRKSRFDLIEIGLD